VDSENIASPPPGFAALRERLHVPIPPEFQTISRPPPRSSTPTNTTDQNFAEGTIPDISLLADTSHRSFTIPATVIEDDLSDMVPAVADASKLPPLTYTVVDGATKRSKARLVSSHNYVYNFKKTLKSGHIVWQCCVRNKCVYCTAVVKQIGDVFMPGSVQHKCVPKTSALAGARVRAVVNTVCL